MWNVNPKILCQRHLLGEHVEMHMFAGCLNRGLSIDGYVRNGLVEPDKIQIRHDELSVEMLRRGMNHKSPIHKISFPGWNNPGFVNLERSLRDLKSRCPDCRSRIESFGNFESVDPPESVKCECIICGRITCNQGCLH